MVKRTLEITDGNVVDIGIIILPEMVACSGRLVDGARNPIANATISASRPPLQGESLNLSGRPRPVDRSVSITDQYGLFDLSVSGIDDKVNLLVARRFGLNQVSRKFKDITVPSNGIELVWDDVEVQIELLAPDGITRVRDLAMLICGTESNPCVCMLNQTNEHGFFVAKGLERGETYQLRLTGTEEYASCTSDLIIPPNVNNVTTFTIQLAKPATLSLRVVDEKSNPLSGIEVEIVPNATEQRSGARVVNTMVNGQVTVSGLPKLVRVIIQPAGFIGIEKIITLDLGSTNVLGDFVLVRQ